MRYDSFKYLARLGWRNMAANRLMTLASIGVLTTCLIITGVAGLLSLNVNRIVDYLYDQNEIKVYIFDTATLAQHETLGQQIAALDNVESAVYVSQEEALQQMLEWMGEKYAPLFTGYEDVLPASYRVTLRDLTKMNETAAALGNLPYVEEVWVPQQLAEVMVNLKNVVNYGGWGLVALLALVAMVVISNTIRLTVFNRRREINIMKYVGATNQFIRMPFFIEGMTTGVIAGLIASVVVCLIYFVIIQLLNQGNMLWAAGMISRLYTFWQVCPFVVLAFLLGGMLLGSIGTAASVKKHLQV